MDETFLSILIGAVAGAVVVILNKVYEGRKVNHEIRLSDTEKAGEIVRAVATDLRRDLEALKAEMRVIEQAHRECREENIRLSMEMGALKHGLERLERQADSTSGIHKGGTNHDQEKADTHEGN